MRGSSPRMRQATLADVARLAGVSPATASRVLNGTGTRVADALRSRVLEAAEHLHYVPNAHAQALMRRANQTVGVLAFNVSNPYFVEITSAIFGVATETGRLVTIAQTGAERDNELSSIALLRSQQVSAIVLAGSGRVDAEHNARVQAQLDVFRNAGGRAAVIGRHDLDVDAVVPDNVGGGEAAARALLDLGHVDVGIISGSTQVTVTVDRLGGFCSVMAAAGRPVPAERIVEGAFLVESGAEAMAALLERAPEVTAVYCINDAMAIGALRLLRERGIEVPGRMSVMWFEDIDMAKDVWLALSTVHVPLRGLGETAMRLLLEPVGDEPRMVRLPTKLCLRGTTARQA